MIVVPRLAYRPASLQPAFFDDIMEHRIEATGSGPGRRTD
jgi:hypothetical protein